MQIVLFDIDGTLISSGGAGKEALENGFLAEFGCEPRIAKLSLSGRTDRAIVRDLLLGHDMEDSEANRARLITAYLRHLPECLASLKGRVLPGIAELLETLVKRKDVALGLLTGNVRAGAKVKLGHFRLFDHFAFGGFGDHHLDRDDVAREAWVEVQRRFNERAAPDRIWVVGDTPLDVRCARAIGAHPIAVATGWHSVEELAAAGPELLLTDLSDPAALLERLG